MQEASIKETKNGNVDDKYISPRRLKSALESFAPGGGGTWGTIQGLLSDQTDLMTALGAKLDKTGGTITGAVGVRGGEVLFPITGDILKLTTAGTKTIRF